MTTFAWLNNTSEHTYIREVQVVQKVQVLVVVCDVLNTCRNKKKHLKQNQTLKLIEIHILKGNVILLI